MDVRRFRSIPRVLGRILSFVLFIYLLLVVLVSTVYGMVNLFHAYPRLVGIPCSVAIGLIIFLFVLFFVRSRSEVKRQHGQDGRAVSERAVSNHLNSDL